MCGGAATEEQPWAVHLEFMFYDNSRLQPLVEFMSEADGRSVSETKTLLERDLSELPSEWTQIGELPAV